VVPDGVEVLEEVEVDCRGYGARERLGGRREPAASEAIESQLDARADVEPRASWLAIMAGMSAVSTEGVVSSAFQDNEVAPRWLWCWAGVVSTELPASCRLSAEVLAWRPDGVTGGAPCRSARTRRSGCRGGAVLVLGRVGSGASAQGVPEGAKEVMSRGPWRWLRPW
jgi:hypothetical protein